ncbi:hypothetical protein I6F14_01980 [Bradyrhizobium sp. IC3069]|uniref:hypothetical protein n=1 Tax=unclassified Bradyrhizobium TaxID=2631580 RepID=UPI001CD60E7A|nr:MULTISPECIES: hypothetical protein [unclassified Bradyrhizobium]MCA1360311.1 hypothetical protein [Bradyrhizobium sp. IC4059]MCA1516801.1 hypothetical protein [Bradyrhizobium sp. IC3069]
MRFQRHLHLLAAALLAAFAATIAFVIPSFMQIEETINIVVITQGLNLTMTTFMVATAHAVLLGLPLYLLISRKRSHVGIAACALGGFAVGAMPFGVLALISMIGGGTPTTINWFNGAPPPFGWIEYVSTLGLLGSLGLVGGLTFWAAIRISGSDERSWRVVSAAVLLTCGVFVLPVVVRDKSCHNLFRDSRTPVRLQVHANLRVPPEEWKKLEQTFADFGQAQALSIRRNVHSQDGNVIWRSVSLCNDAGISISVDDEPWLARIHPTRADEGMTLSIYSLRSGWDWKPLTRHLLGELEKIWPEKTTFRGLSGQILLFEDAMKGRP